MANSTSNILNLEKLVSHLFWYIIAYWPKLSSNIVLSEFVDDRRAFPWLNQQRNTGGWYNSELLSIAEQLFTANVLELGLDRGLNETRGNNLWK